MEGELHGVIIGLVCDIRTYYSGLLTHAHLATPPSTPHALSFIANVCHCYLSFEASLPMDPTIRAIGAQVEEGGIVLPSK